MTVIRANIQTVDDIYRLVWTAISTKHPIEAMCQGRRRLLCPHRLGRNRSGQTRILCYRYGGESRTGLQHSNSPEDWRCLVLEKLSRVRLIDDTRRTAPNHSRPAPCVVDADIDAED